MAQDPLYVGTVGPPAALVIEVTPGSTGVDMTTITGCSISVKKPNGVIVTWSAVKATGSNFPGVPAPTPTAIYFVHVYVAGDLDRLGTYVAWPTSFEPTSTFGEAEGASFVVSAR